MPGRISVLIVDDNIEFCTLLNDYLLRYDDISVCGIVRDGLSAIELIKSRKPDIVILDIIMPGLDGIGVLERISAQHLSHKPLFIMLSAIGQDIFVQKAVSLGAEYFIMKPFDIEILVARIRSVYAEKHTVTIINSSERIRQPSKNELEEEKHGTAESVVTDLLHSMGILPHLGGYHYLRDAIVMSVEGNHILNSTAKLIYPRLAEKYNTSSRRVERAVRCAIASAWQKGHLKGSERTLAISLDVERERPLASKFISLMADRAKDIMKSRKRK